ncbi:MAG TPA: cytochrome o ubiquinol oxidase subunit IV [Burkholderiaceae bacterium]|nr:cytochrome o ubiquinol oxidase subunit IV [Burkholderiaceae bacterium]
MSNDIEREEEVRRGDIAPGDEQGPAVVRGVLGYLIGFALAAALTAVSFYITRSTLVWTPSIPIALSVLAVAQMGVHVVFFLHMTSGSDNLNNLLALAFGLLIVLLLVLGSLWIMSHLNHRTMPVEHIMRMQR